MHVKVAANDLVLKSRLDTVFYLVAQANNHNYYTTRCKLTDPVFTADLPTSRFPQGIVRLTLLSQSFEPLNERVVFINDNSRLTIDAPLEKRIYATKEKVKINLNVTHTDKTAVTGSFSVAVTDETKVPVDEPAERTIFTDLLLASELKGRIENPNYYFNNQNEKIRSDLDLLMLTQGYRHFEWKKAVGGDTVRSVYQPETSLSISGFIKTPNGKAVPNAKVRLTSVKDLFVADTTANQDGFFTFKNINFSDSAKVVINATNSNGGNNVKITLINPQYFRFKPTLISDSPFETGADTLFKSAINKSYFKAQQTLSKRVIQLNEVKIKDNRNKVFEPVYSDNMKLSANLNGPGNADQVISEDVIMRDGGGLLSEILPSKLFNIDLKRMVPIVDGLQLSPNELDAINPADIYSIEVLKRAKFLTIYGSSVPHGALIITLKHGSGHQYSNGQINGLITYQVKGYSKVKEFYSPRYDIKSNKQIADDRKTIYWNPNIITDSNGRATFEYFNAQSPGTYRMVIEGIDGYGNLGRQVLRYKVE